MATTQSKIKSDNPWQIMKLKKETTRFKYLVVVPERRLFYPKEQINTGVFTLFQWGTQGWKSALYSGAAIERYTNCVLALIYNIKWEGVPLSGNISPPKVQKIPSNFGPN